MAVRRMQLYSGAELFGNAIVPYSGLKVHKIENFFDSDFGICVISLLVMLQLQRMATDECIVIE